MSYGFTGELQQLVQGELAKGVYSDEDELLVAALKVFREREQAYEELRAEVQSRVESLDRGEGIELDGDGELRAFIDEIKAEGRRDLEATRKGL